MIQIVLMLLFIAAAIFAPRFLKDQVKRLRNGDASPKRCSSTIMDNL